MLWTCLAVPLHSEIKEQTDGGVRTIIVCFEEEYSSEAFREMKTEVASILRPAGISVIWSRLKEHRPPEVVGEIVVARFKGSCGIAQQAPYSAEVRVLGWTYVTDGKVLPFVWVECDHVRTLIGSYIDGRRRRGGARLGRALGRVLAHEIFHVLSGWVKHRSWGLAKSFFTADDLVADHFGLDPKEVKALRKGR